MTATVFVVGGQRSGKSRYAEALVEKSGRRPLYVATAEPGDGEMAERIRLHRARRGPDWRTVEEPLAIAEVVAAEARPDTAVLVDCLTLWLANLMGAGRDVDAEADRLAAALGAVTGPVVIVSNEVGSGVVPGNPLARRYADALGTLNQRIAAASTRVVLMAAGCPVLLKPSSSPEVSL
jgi:adenosylcobinamide kinase/adenosylcobinamide-phosphate guanylyltransferase